MTQHKVHEANVALCQSVLRACEGCSAKLREGVKILSLRVQEHPEPVARDPVVWSQLQSAPERLFRALPTIHLKVGLAKPSEGLRVRRIHSKRSFHLAQR